MARYRAFYWFAIIFLPAEAQIIALILY